jgi:nucleotide-binding universal stress UspA family protein
VPIEQAGGRPVRDSLHAASSEGAGIAATGLAPVGDPADEILKAAKQFEAELIVMGHARSARWERLVLGSASTKVMHESGCDVLIVK